jgi:HJR/Mrr/RecB family endonuclease
MSLGFGLVQAKAAAIASGTFVECVIRASGPPSRANPALVDWSSSAALIGDQGVDLVVDIGQRRYAIQAKGYVNSVGNSAVQEAVAGMAHYGCNCSAVITNSRFTAGAVALAESNCCVLIGEDQIPAFVLGQMQL